MVLLIEIESRDETGELVTVNQQSIFVVGDGGFGGPRSSEHANDVAKIPDRDPDKVSVYQTSEDQAALYRMSGDLNPLHINPDFAAFGGFSTPILHGLCSLGISVRQLVDTWAEGDASQLSAVKVVWYYVGVMVIHINSCSGQIFQASVARSNSEDQQLGGG